MISVLLPDFRGGGAERVQLDLAYEFARAGYDVEFVLMRKTGEFLKEAEANFPVIHLRAPRVRNVPIPLLRYLRVRQPDALLVAMWPLTAIVPVVARAAGFRRRVAISEHAVLGRQYRCWGKLHYIALRASTFFGYRLSDALIGVSNGVCDEMSALSLMRRHRFVTIYNPLRTISPPSPKSFRRAERLWGGGGARILSVGTFKPVKNHALLLHAFSRLSNPESVLMLVGQGELEQQLRVLAVELGIAERVIFAGFHADLAPFYATADLFVLSSDHEGFGNVIVEALSFGLPVVSTDCPSGPAEILDGGRFGRLIPVGDAEALSRAMEEALSAPVDRQMLRARAADFSPEKVARQYLEVLGL